MIDGEDGGGDEPRKAKHGLDNDNDCQYLATRNIIIFEQKLCPKLYVTHQQVQMISTTLLKLMFLPIYDDRCNLLIHEDEDGGEHGEHRCEEDIHPPRIYQRMFCDHESVYHHPTSSRCWLERVRHNEFRRVHVGEVAHERHGKNGNGHGKVRQ